MLEIAIPVFHAHDTLSKALDSLVAQTKSMFITCLSIDGDNEDYNDIINIYRARGLKIRTITAENGGPGAARQRAIDSTQADYIMFLDADDMLMPRAAEVLYGEAKAHNYDLIKSQYIHEKPGGQGYICGTNTSITHCHGKIYKVSYLKDNNINFLPELNCEEDAYFNVVAYNASTNKGEIEEVTYLWRWNKNSITHSEDYYKKSYVQYFYSQVKGLQKIFDIQDNIQNVLVSQTLINLYQYYHRALFYKFDMKLVDKLMRELVQVEWFDFFINQGENWLDIISNLPAGMMIDDENMVFFEETFPNWIKRLREMD